MVIKSQQNKRIYIFCKNYFSFLSLIWLLEANEHLIDILSVCEVLRICAMGKSFINSDIQSLEV